MELRVLGPVEAFMDGVPVDLGAPRQRCVLAVLALEPNRVIPVERLIDAVWDADAPPAAKSSVQAYVSRLRRAFGPVEGVSLTSRGGGYRLDIAEAAIDLHRFRSLAAQARSAAEPAIADGLFREALALWRGDPLADVRTRWLDDRVCPGLDDERLDVREDHVDCRLRLGGHAEAVATLRGLVAQFPTRERLTGQLMVALYRCGQKTAALEVYQKAADRIADELGLDPGPDLRRVHEGLLRDDDWLAAPSLTATPPNGTPMPPAGDPMPVRVKPAQLPGDTAAFIGRQDELALLDARHRSVAGPPAGVRITAITGTAGVGKTSLALHWGHRAAAAFADGSLYLNLRGFDDQLPPVEPVDALRQLLGGLGAEPRDVPRGVDERSALFRSMLADRDVLLVLDNARGSKQVRPLLPGSARCHVLVTSRTRLDGLVALDGAQQISLDSLPQEESVALLAAIAGGDRVGAEAEAAARLAELCGQLPLGLRVAGAQLAARAQCSIAEFVEELADYQNRLDALDLVDLDTPLRATFDVSYQALSAPAAAAFRLVGLHPGPDLAAEVLAAAMGEPVARIRRFLGELATAHLVTEYAPGRFAMHDLLRAYALEKANELPGREQGLATDRMLDYYLDVALDGREAQFTGFTSRDGVVQAPADKPRFASTADATAWFETERANLLAAVRHSAGRPDPRHAFLLPNAMFMYFELARRWEDALGSAEIGLHCAQRVGDTERQLTMLNLLGAAAGSGMPAADAGRRHFERMYALAVEVGNARAAAMATTNIAMALRSGGQAEEAVGYLLRALELVPREDRPWDWANMQNNLCLCRIELGDADAALAAGRDALEVFAELGDSNRQAMTLDNLGRAHRLRGDLAEARRTFEQGLDLARRTGNRRVEATLLSALGDLAYTEGDRDRAIACWEAVLPLGKLISERELADLRRRIAACRQVQRLSRA